jgi:hypothetical protein
VISQVCRLRQRRKYAEPINLATSASPTGCSQAHSSTLECVQGENSLSCRRVVLSRGVLSTTFCRAEHETLVERAVAVFERLAEGFCAIKRR